MAFLFGLFALFERKAAQVPLNLLSLAHARIVLSYLLHLEGFYRTHWLCAALHLRPQRKILLRSSVEDLLWDLIEGCLI